MCCIYIISTIVDEFCAFIFHITAGGTQFLFSSFIPNGIYTNHYHKWVLFCYAKDSVNFGWKSFKTIPFSSF